MTLMAMRCDRERLAGWRAGVLSAVVSVVVVLVAAPGANAVAKYPDRLIAGEATSGSAAGQLNGVRGVAVNEAGVADGSVDPLGASTDGYVYVADTGNHRIQVFTSDGEFRFMIGSGVAGGIGGEVCDQTELPCTPAVAGADGGELNLPQGVAVNQANGDLYVSEIGNRRVSQFAADGTLIRVWGWGVDDGSNAFQVCDAPADLPCQAAVAGGNGGQFSAASHFTSFMDIEVSPTAPHHVFVGDPSAGISDNGRLHEYAPDGSFVRLWGWDVVAAGQPGDLGTDAFEICASTTPGVCKRYVPTGQDSSLSGRFGNVGPGPIAVDGTTGIVYTTSEGSWSPRIQRFDSTESSPANLLLPQFNSVADLTGANALAVNASSGNLFVARGNSSGIIQELDMSVEPPAEVERHLEGSEEGSEITVRGLAAEASTGALFFSTTLPFGPRVFRADDGGAGEASMEVDPVVVHGDGTSATFSGTVNPNGPEGFATEYNFEYTSDGVNWEPVPGSENPLGDGTDPIAVSDEVTGLEEGATYRVRLRTQKAFGNPIFYSPEVTFTTASPPPDVETVAPQARGQRTATITGLVNPNNSPTTFYFEWGTDTSYGNRAPIPPGDAGSGFGTRAVSVRIDGLQPNTTYHYRVVADNGVEVAPGVTEVRGNDVSFTTRSASAAPAGRAFELVTPADKVGGQGTGFWPWGLGHIASAGVAAHTRERFMAVSLYGSVLSNDGAFGLNTDWSAAERMGNTRGWESRPVLSHPNYRPGGAGQVAEISAAADDFSSIFWTSGATLAWFPEMGPSNPDPAQPEGWTSFDAGMLSNWGGPSSGPTRWELFGPRGLRADQVAPADEVPDKLWTMAFSDDGSSAFGATTLTNTTRLPGVHGLAGPDDPTLPSNGDLVSGRSIYHADLSGGLADTFAGTGERTLVNVCTGTAGTDRTVVPAVTGGVLSEQECAPGNDGRQRLISDHGAAYSAGDRIASGAVSRDGSRVFFLAPDPGATGVPNGTSESCTGAAAGTLCPPQLYVRQRNLDGSIVTRWISKADDGLFGEQAASLTGSVRFEGASDDGSTVFFRTNSPLTVDDPNGSGASVPDGVRTGTPHPESWDLYGFTLAGGADPTGPGSSLTRISAGPDGQGDCNSSQPALSSDLDTDSVGALRFLSEDGKRAYFTCQGVLPAVPGASNGTITAPGGTPTTTDQTNLYLYDANLLQAERWRFVARLPRTTGSDSFASCATTGVTRATPFGGGDGLHPQINDNGAGSSNCVSGSGDGGFVTLFTPGALTADDTADGVADIYGYDADADELVRVTAPQGGEGAPYPCVGDDPQTGEDERLRYSCHGDGGVDSQVGAGSSHARPTNLGVVVDSGVVGGRVAFFQSASRLVAGDLDDGYDVYEWRDGELSLLTSGAADSEDALYKGNDRSGRNVYFVTRDALTWQDTDAVADVYTARVGGGVAEPVVAPVCAVLAGGCQAPGGAGSVAFNLGPGPSGGDVRLRFRTVVSLGRVGRLQRRRAARLGVLRVRVRTNRAGLIRVGARARIGGRSVRVGGARKRVARPGSTVVRLRLSRRARRVLASGRVLRVRVRVAQEGARSRSATVRLRRGGRR
jgi:hypothetical protein